MSVMSDVRAVDVDEKELREIRVIIKVGGPQRDPSDGLRLRASSVKYDFRRQWLRCFNSCHGVEYVKIIF